MVLTSVKTLHFKTKTMANAKIFGVWADAITMRRQFQVKKYLLKATCYKTILRALFSETFLAFVNSCLETNKLFFNLLQTPRYLSS